MADAVVKTEVSNGSSNCSFGSEWPTPALAEYDNIGEYYFESDHLAIRGNQDYQSLLRNVAILEAQKAKAIQDLDRLIEARDEALANPIAFVEKLQRNEDLNLPKPQVIAAIPNIDWEKYSHNTKFPSLSHHHMTRRRVVAGKSFTVTAVTTETPTTTATAASAAAPPKVVIKKEEPDEEYDLSQNSSSVVRGRICNEAKPQSFNQLWTVREQKQLEELLVQFPPEDVEARRWEKIAETLGNRTPQQVASRVQKYFIKLAKAGLPIPGRTPNVNCYSKKGSHRHQRHNRFLFQPSTFFTSHEPPVFMSDQDDDHGSGYALSVGSSGDGDFSGGERMDFNSDDDEDIPPELHNTEEYKQLMYLKNILKQDYDRMKTYAQHVGFKCDRCDCEPILGTRWHCVDCPQQSSVDFCDDCVDCVHETSTHRSNHRLEPVHEARNTYVDGDYTHFRPGDYNYLDPNYMPAT